MAIYKSLLVSYYLPLLSVCIHPLCRHQRTFHKILSTSSSTTSPPKINQTPGLILHKSIDIHPTLPEMPSCSDCQSTGWVKEKCCRCQGLRYAPLSQPCAGCGASGRSRKNRGQPCGDCNGQGEIYHQVVCPYCMGSGEEPWPVRCSTCNKQ